MHIELHLLLLGKEKFCFDMDFNLDFFFFFAFHVSVLTITLSKSTIRYRLELLSYQAPLYLQVGNDCHISLQMDSDEITLVGILTLTYQLLKIIECTSKNVIVKWCLYRYSCHDYYIKFLHNFK